LITTIVFYSSANVVDRASTIVGSL